MNMEALWGIGGILATAAAGVWAINDARKQVKEQITVQRNLAWARIVTDFMWDFVDPTEKIHNKEITKGLADFVLLSKALDPRKKSDTLKSAANYEALEMAHQFVGEGFAKWKPNLDTERLQEMLQEWKTNKDTAREQLSNRKIWSRIRRFFRRRTKSPS